MLNVASYYVFGFEMESYGGESEFGFDGMQKDNAINSDHYTTFFRENDAKYGRWWGVDPKILARPWESPYSSMGNNPISNIDPMGDIWDRTKDKKHADKMDKNDNDRIKSNNTEITNLQKSKGNDDAIKSLKAQNTDLQNSIDERVKMGSDNDPTRYRFEKTNNGKTGKITNEFGEDVIIMRYSNLGESNHEQLHGYRRGRELLNKEVYDSGYDADEEAEATRREYSTLSVNQHVKMGKPFLQKGYFYITTENWVKRVVELNSDHVFGKEFKRKHKKYIKVANEWLKQHEKPLMKK